MATLYTEHNPPKTVEEGYASAAGSSNLRVETREGARGAGDMILAAGMNPHRLGMALTRLASEWDGAAKPLPLNPRAVELLAKQLDVEPAQVLCVAAGDPELKLRPNPHAGLVRIKEGTAYSYRTPIAVAADQAQAWHTHELGLLFQRLKTLPAVRAALVVHFQAWAAERGEDPASVPHVVGRVLEWWLAKVCPACNGVKFKVVQGTGRTSSKACTTCRGSGEKKLPHGYMGRQVLKYIGECRAAAIGDLKGRLRADRERRAGAC